MRFARPADLVPDWPGLPSPEAAAGVVLRRYLGAHGPAELDTVTGWLSRGATRSSDMRRWIAALGPAIATVDVDGTPCLALAEDLDELASTRQADDVRLLPAFDPYVLGAGTGNPWLLEPRRRSAVSRAGGWISPVVLAGGRVVGTWSEAGGRATVEMFAERVASVDREALVAEARRAAGGGAVTVRTA